MTPNYTLSGRKATLMETAVIDGARRSVSAGKNSRRLRRLLVLHPALRHSSSTGDIRAWLRRFCVLPVWYRVRQVSASYSPFKTGLFPRLHGPLMADCRLTKARLSLTFISNLTREFVAKYRTLLLRLQEESVEGIHRLGGYKTTHPQRDFTTSCLVPYGHSPDPDH